MKRHASQSHVNHTTYSAVESQQQHQQQNVSQSNAAFINNISSSVEGEQHPQYNQSSFSEQQFDDDTQNEDNINFICENELSVPLIEEVRKYPCIWDISCKSHKDKFKKMEAWRRVLAALRHPGM